MNRAQFIRWLLVAVPATWAAETREDELPRAVVAQHARLAHADYEDSLAAAVTLQRAVADFLTTPGPAQMAAARQAWLAARVPYVQTEACRFYDGPIDQVEPFLNAWPMDEALIDYVVGQPQAGVVNSVKEFPSSRRSCSSRLTKRKARRTSASASTPSSSSCGARTRMPKAPATVRGRTTTARRPPRRKAPWPAVASISG